MTALEKVLLVDDDERLVQSLARRLRTRFDIETAIGPTVALEQLAANGPPSVVVSDYQMPVMHGVAFLERVRERYPDTVRIMLTGQADLEVAMNAVNNGAIFRFLTKPCPGEVLCRAIDDGIEVVRLRRGERNLLEKTLTGSVAVLCDVLSLSNPSAFGRATRLRSLVHRVTARVGIADAWRVEAAAMLGQIGWVALPPDLLSRSQSGRTLEADELEALARLPSIAAELLERIPRLDSVARIIRGSAEPSTLEDESERCAARVLGIAQAVEARMAAGESTTGAVQEALSGASNVPAAVAAAFRGLRDATAPRGERTIRIAFAVPGACVAADVVSVDGTKLLGRGQVLSAGALARLRTYVQLGRLEDRIVVDEAAAEEAA